MDEDINLLSRYGDIYIEAEVGGIDIVAGTDIRSEAGGHHSEKAGEDHKIQTTGSMHRQAGIDINHDAGCMKYEQSGTSQPADTPENATEATPKGERNT